MWYRKAAVPGKLRIGPVSRDLAKAIGDEMGVDWNKIDLHEWQMGLVVEQEHGVGAKTNLTHLDPRKTAEIALAHLLELPDYYTRLRKMESEGESEDR